MTKLFKYVHPLNWFDIISCGLGSLISRPDHSNSQSNNSYFFRTWVRQVFYYTQWLEGPNSYSLEENMAR